MEILGERNKFSRRGNIFCYGKDKFSRDNKRVCKFLLSLIDMKIRKLEYLRDNKKALEAELCRTGIIHFMRSKEEYGLGYFNLKIDELKHMQNQISGCYMGRYLNYWCLIRMMIYEDLALHRVCLVDSSRVNSSNFMNLGSGREFNFTPMLKSAPSANYSPFSNLENRVCPYHTLCKRKLKFALR